jgi:Flp pilus assembly protein TadD
MASPQEMLDRAVALQRIGRADQALPLYVALLRTNPDHPVILHFAGAAFHQMGQDDTAEKMLARAVEHMPDDPELRHNHAVVLQALGRIEDAVAAYEAALTRDALRPVTLAILGGILGVGERRNDGVDMMRRAAVLAPDLDEVWVRLANHAHTISDAPVSARYRRRALLAAPANPERWVSQALALMDLELGERARRHFQAAATIAPHMAETYNHLGYLETGRLRFADAHGAFGRARVLKPALASAYAGLSEAHFAEGDVESAIARMRQALEISPGETHYRFRLGIQLLSVGQMEEGWERYGWLRSKPTSVRREAEVALWNGVPGADRTLLIAADQGIGDEILHACCIPDVAADVGRVVIECDQRLVTLFQRSFPAALVHPYVRVGDRHRPEHLYDWVPESCRPLFYADGAVLLSKYRGTVAQADAAARPWLVPDPERVAGMRAALDALGPGLKVGVAWRSRRLTTFRLPHYPGIAPFEAVFEAPGVTFVSLQYGIGWEQEIAERTAPVAVIPGLDTTNDIEGVFALVAALDLVICPSSTVGWIAASQNRPVWLLYNTPVFLEYGTDRYPGFPSVRCFRKRQAESWRPMMDQVAEALRALSR